MKTDMIKVTVKALLAAALLCSTQACTAGAGMDINQNPVAQAYETSGVVSIAPYNRSIFSTSNF